MGPIVDGRLTVKHKWKAAVRRSIKLQYSMLEARYLKADNQATMSWR